MGDIADGPCRPDLSSSQYVRPERALRAHSAASALLTAPHDDRTARVQLPARRPYASSSRHAFALHLARSEPSLFARRTDAAGSNDASSWDRTRTSTGLGAREHRTETNDGQAKTRTVSRASRGDTALSTDRFTSRSSACTSASSTDADHPDRSSRGCRDGQNVH